MSSNTPNLNLLKPAGNDLVNVITQISDNYDKIDAAPKVHVGPATPSFAPGTKYVWFQTGLPGGSWTIWFEDGS